MPPDGKTAATAPGNCENASIQKHQCFSTRPVLNQGCQCFRIGQQVITLQIEGRKIWHNAIEVLVERVAVFTEVGLLAERMEQRQQVQVDKRIGLGTLGNLLLENAQGTLGLPQRDKNSACWRMSRIGSTLML